MRKTPASESYIRHGLSLPASVLKALHKRGIYCVTGISVEHQHLAGRYVLRGIESGGAVSDMGRVCAFVSPNGSALPWFQSLQNLAINGRHAIFLAKRFVRVEMLRTQRSYELAITLHNLSNVIGRKRSEISTTLVFRGRDGELPVDLWKEQHRALRGTVMPIFYDRAGQILHPPCRFEDTIRKITEAVCCVGCRHTHIGVPDVLGGGSRSR